MNTTTDYEFPIPERTFEPTRYELENPGNGVWPVTAEDHAVNEMGWQKGLAPTWYIK